VALNVSRLVPEVALTLWKRSRITLIAGILGALFVISFYIALSTKGSMKFGESDGYANYNMFAQAILSGRLSIGDIPYRCLAAGSDPRDPSACPPPVIDVIAYSGKYYLLQEPLPVLFHLFSFLILGKALPTGIAIILFSCGSLCLLGMIITKLRNLFFANSPRWPAYLALSYFAFSGVQLYMVSRQLIYHETIVVAAFFMLLGTLCFLQALPLSSNEKKWFGLAGTFLGASVLSKISMIWYPVCFWLLYLIFQIKEEESFQRIAMRTVSFAAPLACSGLVLLTYNYLRFGDPADFGRTHVVLPSKELYNYCILQDNFLRFAHVPYNLASYFTTFPEFVWRHGLPGLRFPLETINDGNILVAREKTACLFVMAPALLLCLLLPFLLRKCSGDRLLPLTVAVCATPSVVTFLFYLTMMRSVPRYLYEFTPLAYALIYVVLACLWQRLRANSFERTLFILVAILLFTLNTITGGYLGLNGITQG
jgi:hypothetical protein